MKSEVKKKMMHQRRKSRYQSHEENCLLRQMSARMSANEKLHAISTMRGECFWERTVRTRSLAA
jgi:hypothetical protein